MNKKLEKTINSFLVAWSESNYQKMYELTNHTWRSKHTKKKLKKLLPKRIKSFKVIAAEEMSEYMFDVILTLRIEGKTKRVTARCLCELAPFKPSKNGVFGINPVSVIRNLY